jgi:GNAT superfamily N-acetyltransferase
MPQDTAAEARETPRPDGSQLRQLVTIRPAEEGDTALLFNSWLRSYRDSPRVNGTPSALYYRYHHPLVTRVLARPESSVLCAVDPRKPDRIHGWLCFEWAGSVLVVHYLYVKQIWRRKGIARLLAETAGLERGTPVAYTFESKAAPHLAKRVKRCEYVPCEEYLSPPSNPDRSNP